MTSDPCVLPQLDTNTVIVDHVILNQGTNPVTTHICLESTWRGGLKARVAIFTTIFIFVLFVAIVAV